MRYLLNIVIAIGLAAYIVAFYAAPMSSFPLNDAGLPLSRLETLLLFSCWKPVDWLFANWFGGALQCGLADRWRVVLAAGLILAWAAAVGWLLLGLFRRFAGEDHAPAPMKTEPSPSAPLRVGAASGWRLTRLERFVFAEGIGLGVLSTWTLSMGLLGVLGRRWVFTAPAIATLLAVVCVCFRRMQKAADRRRLAAAGLSHNAAVGGPRRDLPPDDSDNFHYKRWLWLAAPFVAAIFLASMLPPTDFDVCEYHLQAPKEFFQQGKITFLPHNVYANMPLGAEMLSLLAMVISGSWWWGALAGKTVTAAFTPLCALAVYAAGRRFYSTSAGVIGALIFLSVPWIVGVSSAGLVEGVAACYLFLAVYAMLLSGSTSAERHPMGCTCPTAYLALAGYFAGAAVAVKYPAVLFVLLPLAAWTFVGRLWAGMRGQGAEIRGQGMGGKGQNRVPFSPLATNPELLAPNPQLRAANRHRRTANPLASAIAGVLIFLLAAAAGCGLWFGKNWVLTGNPTYPLLYEVFGGKTWNADKDRQWNLAHRPQEFSFESLGKDMDRALIGGELLSPLVVPLAVLSLLGLGGRSRSSRADGRDRRAKRLAWGLMAYTAFVIAAWWLLTHRIDRFWLPVLPVAALLAGAGACWNSSLWWRAILSSLLLFGLAGNFLLAAGGGANAWFVPLKQLDNDPHWINPWHRALNGDAAHGAVLTVGDAAVFDLKATVFYSTCFDDCVFEQLVKDKTAVEIRDELAARRIVYVLVNWDEIKRYRDTYGFTDFVQREVFEKLVKEGVLEPVQSRPNQYEELYRVRPSP